MGQRRRSTPEFKLQAVRLLEAGQRPAAAVARLKRELTGVTEERDILKEAATYFARESG